MLEDCKQLANLALLQGHSLTCHADPLQPHDAYQYALLLLPILLILSLHEETQDTPKAEVRAESRGEWQSAQQGQ